MKDPVLTDAACGEAEMAESDFVLTSRADVARKPRLAGSGFARANAVHRRLVVISNRVTPTAAAKPDSGGLAGATSAAPEQSGRGLGPGGAHRPEKRAPPAPQRPPTCTHAYHT